MPETRTAYRIEIDFSGEQVIETYQCVITPKRVAVTRQTANGWPWGTQHFDLGQGDWPRGRYAWTVADAWAKFIAEQRKELAELKDSVTRTEQQLAAAERAAGTK